jgi:hypothetical protein
MIFKFVVSFLQSIDPDGIHMIASGILKDEGTAHKCIIALSEMGSLGFLRMIESLAENRSEIIFKIIEKELFKHANVDNIVEYYQTDSEKSQKLIILISQILIQYSNLLSEMTKICLEEIAKKLRTNNN